MVNLLKIKFKVASKIYRKIKEKLEKLVEENNLGGERVVVKARALTPDEAIGNPERDDFPLLKGKERMMQAEFKGSFGQAFTDMHGNFEGTLDYILNMEPNNNYRRAIFIATLNAVMRHLNLIEGTVHCRDEGPIECSRDLVEFISEDYKNPKITFIGLQPALVDRCSKNFELRILDLDKENIGREKFGTVILDGSVDENVECAVSWCDLVIATGSTIINDTISKTIDISDKYQKPIIFYGTTIAGAAKALNLKRFCSRSR